MLWGSATSTSIPPPAFRRTPRSSSSTTSTLTPEPTARLRRSFERNWNEAPPRLRAAAATPPPPTPTRPGAWAEFSDIVFRPMTQDFFVRPFSAILRSQTWTTLREAIRGSHQAYTAGPIGRAIVLLAIPMVLEMVLESVFAVVDVFWVSKLGSDSVATVGMTESILALIYAVAIGLSIGATATVARRIGEKDPERAAASAVQSIALGIAVAVPIGIVCALSARRLLALLGAPASVVATGVHFTQIMLGANVVILLLFLVNAIFRGAGDATMAMRSLWLANIFNLVLDPCLIFGLCPFPRLGVTRAAVATTCGRGMGVLFQVWTLMRGRGRVVIERRHLHLDPPVMLRLLHVSAN